MASTSFPRNNNLARLEDDVSEVTHLLKDNVEKVIQRGEKIDNLQTRSEDLQEGAHQFNRRAGQVRRRMCWQNCRLNCIIAIIVIVVIAVIITIVLVETKPWNKGDSGTGKNLTRTLLRGH